MVKVYTTAPLSVTLESDGQRVTLDVSRSSHLPQGRALHHEDGKATAFIADKLYHGLLAFGEAERGEDGTAPKMWSDEHLKSIANAYPKENGPIAASPEKAEKKGRR